MKKMIIDVFYHEEDSHQREDCEMPCDLGNTFAAGVVFKDWSDSEALEVYTSTSNIKAEYIPGQFYKRELPCILELLKQVDLNEYDTIIVDGLYMLWDGKPGLGWRLYTWLQDCGYTWINVIGVAKSKIIDAEKYATPVIRGKGVTNPLWVNGSLETDYEKLIQGMHGEYRIPTLIKLADKYSRGGYKKYILPSLDELKEKYKDI